MQNELILTAGPSITEKEIEYVTDAVKHGWNKDWNKYILKFEKAFAAHLNVDDTISTSSCTGALHLALLSLGIGPGDEVIVPEITWVASASVVKYVGATPVFCDIRDDSWCIDLSSAESLITNNTRAIIPVYLYGHPPEMDEVLKLANKYNLHVIEDAAPAIGSTFDGKEAGTFGDMSCFSFQGAKILVAGEGGILATKNTHLCQRARVLADHGRDPINFFAATEVGYKYKMSNLQAAMGLAQMERVDELVSKKRLIHNWYRELLLSNDKLKFADDNSKCQSNWWMNSIEILGASYDYRERIRDLLKKNNIDTRPVFSPMSSLPMFERSSENPVSYRVGASALNLPSGHNLSYGQVEYVCSIIHKLL